MSKATFPKELLKDEIEIKTQTWLEVYKSKTNFDKGYYQKLENFFKFIKFTNKSFDQFEIHDIEEYLEVLYDNDYSVSLIDSLISNLSSFKTFLINEYPETFSQYFLSDILQLKIGQKDKKYADSRPLTYRQLTMTKLFIKSNIRTEYIFQVFYQLGIDKKDFHCCTPKNALRYERAFVKDNLRIEYNSVIEELIERASRDSNFKATPNMITDHLKSIQLYLSENNLLDPEQTITYNDVIKTHQKFFLKCPNCERKAESISNNWVLVITDYSDEMHLTCVDCKGQNL